MAEDADQQNDELSPEEREALEIKRKVQAFKHSDAVSDEELAKLSAGRKELLEAQRMLDKKRGPKLIRSSGSEGNSWQRFAGAGVQLGAAIALFTLGGQWLDDQNDTSPLFTAVGALLGCGGGMWAVIAAVNGQDKKANAKKADQELSENSSLKEEA